MTVPSETPVRQPLPTGALWFGTAGAVLILGGIIALLAANWHFVPFAAQVTVALAPLVLSWVFYAVLTHRGPLTAVAGQILGTVWTGGVLCSVALLGRILQLHSDHFAFCATVTLLLLPVVYATLAIPAWLTAWGFLLATAVAAVDYFPDACNFLIAVAVLPVGIALLLPVLIPLWRSGGPAWLRGLAAVMAVASSAFLAYCVHGLCTEILDIAPFPWVSLSLGLPLILGTLAERRLHPHRALSLVSLPMLFYAFAMVIATPREDYASPLWWTVLSIALVAVTARRLLRNEGLFLLLLPVAALTACTGTAAWPTLGGLAVGIAVLTCGIRTASRMTANEGMVFTLLVAWFGFLALGADLMTQGAILIAGGVALIAVNLVLSRLSKGGRHA